MSFEILGQDENTTVYAPLNTTIDADRDYSDLTGLEACACGGGMPPQMIPPGAGMGDLDGCRCKGRPCPPGLNGFYPDQELTPGMLGELDAAEGGRGMLGVMGLMLGAWALWAWLTPHQEYRQG